jgi:hypothetical protein
MSITMKATGKRLLRAIISNLVGIGIYLCNNPSAIGDKKIYLTLLVGPLLQATDKMLRTAKERKSLL